MEWNILFMGPVGAGKTQAIRSVSDIEVLDTDMQATDETQFIKTHTTVSMDVGAINLPGADKVRLLGAPGQDRFDFMWDILLTQAKGVILLLKHTNPDPLADLEHYLSALEERLIGRNLPLVVGVTHLDQKPGQSIQPYQERLSQRGCKVADRIPPVFAMDVRKKAHVETALITMTALLEMRERYPDQARATF